MSHPLLDRHKNLLDSALNAISSRTCFSAYPEVPSGKIYGESAKDDAAAAFKARLNMPFDLPGHPASGRTVGEESSPYGFPLGIKYPAADIEKLIAASHAASASWRDQTMCVRAGVLLEILARLNKSSFDIANAVMHTTGQAFMMAFQAGGPHAQDRALEAIATAFAEMKRVPHRALWHKQVSKTESVSLNKTFTIVPRGIAVAIGCSTFPTWNSYPGIFASLVTGNSVIIKPHPAAVLPLALTVLIARQVLSENGLDPNIILLAADSADHPLTKPLVTHPAVRIIDYTGSSAFGAWIEEHARQAVVFTEKAGVNSTIIDSLADLPAVAANIAFTLCLYSGQMCTASQNIFIPRAGISTAAGRASFDDVVSAIKSAIDDLLADPKRAVEVLGAIQNSATIRRIDHAAAEGAKVLRPSSPITHPLFPGARVRSPLVLLAEPSRTDLFMREMFGPISYIIPTSDSRHSIELAARSALDHGAITWSLYSTSDDLISRAHSAACAAGAPLSINLTGPIYVNQAAAFSDFHVSGANPAGNATLCDAAFVAPRFRVVQSRSAATPPSLAGADSSSAKVACAAEAKAETPSHARL